MSSSICFPIIGGLGSEQLAPPWSRDQVKWFGQGYFVLRLATEDVSRWLLGAAFAWSEVYPHERTFRRSAADKALVMQNLSMSPWPSHLASAVDPDSWREALVEMTSGVVPELDTGHLALWRLKQLPKDFDLGGPFVVLDGHHSRRAQQHIRLPALFGWLEPLDAPQLHVGAIHRAGFLNDWLEQCIEGGELRVVDAVLDETDWTMERSLCFEAIQVERRRWLEVARPLGGESAIDALGRLAKGSVTLKASARFDEIMGWLKDLAVDTALRLPRPTKHYVQKRAFDRVLFPQKATYFHPKVPFGTLVADLAV